MVENCLKLLNKTILRPNFSCATFSYAGSLNYISNFTSFFNVIFEAIIRFYFFLTRAMLKVPVSSADCMTSLFIITSLPLTEKYQPLSFTSNSLNISGV